MVNGFQSVIAQAALQSAFMPIVAVQGGYAIDRRRVQVDADAVVTSLDRLRDDGIPSRPVPGPAAPASGCNRPVP